MPAKPLFPQIIQWGKSTCKNMQNVVAILGKIICNSVQKVLAKNTAHHPVGKNICKKHIQSRH